MLFSSLTFIFIFLPFAIVFHSIVKETKIKNIILLTFSLLFYAWGEPKNVLIMILCITFNYIFALYFEKNKNKMFFILVILLNISTLVFYKYSNFLISNVNRLFHTNFGLLNVIMPIGISFYTFQILSYVIDVYTAKTKALKNIIDLGTYITMFPQLIAGPIVRYTDIEESLKFRKFSYDDLYDGLKRFIIGFGKKIIIANQMGALVNFIDNLKQSTTILNWIAALAFLFQIYFDFSGYSDMAIGLGKMFGFRFLENFNYPYIANTITDFWRRWHISLSSWFKDYVYIPLGGNRVSKPRWLLNIFIVWFLTGMWHGASWNFILWGLYFGFFLVLEKIFLKSEKKKNILNHLFTFFIVLIGFVLFRIDSLNLVFENVKSLFIYDSNSLKYSLSIMAEKMYLLLYFVPAIIFSFKLELNKKLNIYLYDFLLLIIFISSVLFLITQNFNPFIYFRF